MRPEIAELEWRGGSLRFLFVEDSEEDTQLLIRELQRDGITLEYDRVCTRESMIAAMDSSTYDVVIADYNLPRFSGLEALELLQSRNLDLPFIVVSGTIGENVAVEAMKAGAHDYIMKDNLRRLVPAIKRELREYSTRRRRKEVEEEVRTRVEFERILLAISARFINIDPGDVDTEITRTLGEIARFIGASRSSVFRFHDAHTFFSNTHEWCESPVDSQIDKVKNVPVDKVAYYNSLLFHRQVVKVSRLNDLPSEAVGERFWSKEKGFRSLLFVPMVLGDDVVGTLGVYGGLEKEVEWPDGLIALLYFAGDIILQALQRKDSMEELRSSREQLRLLAARLQNVREEEREAIARELHDELGQMLTGMKLDVSWIKRRLDAAASRATDKQVTEKIRTILTLLDETMRCVRRCAMDLRPGLLDDLGLIPALEWAAREFQDRSGIRCEVTSASDHIPLPRDQSTALFRIVQEALTNVLRHSQGERVNIQVDLNNDSIKLTIQDNRRGITSLEVSDPRSLGLLGMRERVHMFSGSVKISGQPGEGTTVTVLLPVDAASSRSASQRQRRSPRQRRVGKGTP